MKDYDDDNMIWKHHPPSDPTPLHTYPTNPYQNIHTNKHILYYVADAPLLAGVDRSFDLFREQSFYGLLLLQMLYYGG